MSPSAQIATFRLSTLRCEYRANPMGIQESRPRLAWILEPVSPTARGLRQTAYQIQVASSPESLGRKPDLWDTGKVKSNKTGQIEYGGKALRSGQRCFWRARAWDDKGRVSEWSATARWSIGLLSQKDWKAQWIEEPDPVNFERCRWTWLADETEAFKKAKARTCCLQKRFTIPKGSMIASATFLIAVDDRFVLYVNGKEAGRGGADATGRPAACRVDLAGVLKAGENLLSIAAANETDGQPAGVTGKLVARLEDRRQLSTLVDGAWVAREIAGRDAKSSKVHAEFHGKWSPARAMVGVGEQDPLCSPLNQWGIPGSDEKILLPPVPQFRKTFTLGKAPVRATVYVGAIGLYELRVNGRRVGNDRLTPGWPDYYKRIYYNTYDLSDYLTEGENVVAATVADGWGAGYVAWGRNRSRFGLEAALRLQIHAEFPDGSTEIVGTDDSWKCTLDGPVREGDLLMGETHDARKEQTGWDRAGFDDSGWTPVALPTPPPPLPLEAYPPDPVRAHEEIRPVHVAEPTPGAFVFDLGQNMVGVARVRTTGPRGTKVRLRFAEVIQEDGTLYNEALRGARSQDTYIKATGGEEIWEPRFTSHGFRYVEVTGLPGRPTRDTITGVVMHSTMEPAGEFSTSNVMVNRLYQNIVWGQKGNFLELPTDCPQRDERLGWTGDAQIFMRTGSFNYDLAAFMTKWIRDLFDAQSKEGWFGVVAPNMPFDALPKFCCHAWSDAAVICPWTMYRVYGDTRILERHYDAMAFYLEFLKKTSENLIRPPGGYGDWVSLNADTPTEVLNTAYFALDARMMSEIATAIGKKKDGEKYAALFQDIKQAFIKTFIGPDSRVKGNTQTCYVLALAFDLLPVEARPSALAHLAQDLAYRSGHFSTGFVGLKDLMPTLTNGGREDLAYRILLNEKFPSWGYEIKSGATTIWERWDGWNDELGLQTPGMNSFNHYAFGAVGEWLFVTVGGIDLLEPGYRRIRIRPRPGGELRNARAQYRSPHGWIVSEWFRDKDGFRLICRVPANTTAEVHVPCAGDPAAIREGGKPVGKVPGIRLLHAGDGEAVFEVASGHYVFTVR